VLAIGSRGSALALRQARLVQQRLEAMGEACRIRIIRTTGDRVLDAPLTQIGGKGLFTKEIEEALLSGEIDLAVHSMKDLPTAMPEGLRIAAVPPREDPRDALAGRTLRDLRPSARVGTGSLRRAAQLRALRPDLEIEPVRGNLDTRLRKLDEGRCDALVVASAGLLRLGLETRIAEVLDVEVVCPAAGQGALAVETRSHGASAECCRTLDDAAARAAVTAERAALAALGGGCQAPVGVHAWIASGMLRITGVVAAEDGSRLVRRSAEGSPADAGSLGRRLGDALLEGGAGEILEAIYGS